MTGTTKRRRRLSAKPVSFPFVYHLVFTLPMSIKVKLDGLITRSLSLGPYRQALPAAPLPADTTVGEGQEQKRQHKGEQGARSRSQGASAVRRRWFLRAGRRRIGRIARFFRSRVRPRFRTWIGARLEIGGRLLRLVIPWRGCRIRGRRGLRHEEPLGKHELERTRRSAVDRTFIQDVLTENGGLSFE